MWMRVGGRNHPISNVASKRGKLIKHLEDALVLADEIQDGRLDS
jgi:hypothetical protein